MAAICTFRAVFHLDRVSFHQRSPSAVLPRVESSEKQQSIDDLSLLPPGGSSPSFIVKSGAVSRPWCRGRLDAFSFMYDDAGAG